LKRVYTTSSKQRWPVLLNDLQSDDENAWQFAGSELSNVPNRRAIKPLIKIMFEGKHPLQREMAGYALAWTVRRTEDELLVTESFIKVLLNKKEDSRVRGQAAEGLGLILDCSDKRKRTYKRAVTALLESLKDDDLDVRFWSSYAVGVLKIKEAIPLLKRLIEDKRVWDNWWTVGEEASDVIQYLETDVWPDRVTNQSNF